jgi:hypothetical protein
MQLESNLDAHFASNIHAWPAGASRAAIICIMRCMQAPQCPTLSDLGRDGKCIGC